MKFALVILLYAIVGSCALAWTNSSGVINPVIAFGLFITYAIFGGIFFKKVSDKGLLI